MSSVSVALLVLVLGPVSLVLSAYLARWVAQFFFTQRESEIVAIAAVIGGAFGGTRIGSGTSALVVVCGLAGWAIGLAVLFKLWRKGKVSHAQ